MLRLSEAGIISTSLQGMLYGLAVLMFLLTMFVLLRDRRRRRINRGMIIASCALILLATVEFAVNIVRLVHGFLTVGPTYPTGIEGFFSDVSEITFIVKGALYNAQTLILDAVVIYRAYVVWQRWWIIMVPCLGWCALLGSTIGLNRAFITASVNTDNVFASQTGRWITATYATTLATNVMATGLLAYRIWRINRRTSEYVASDRLMPILRVVIESGAIYSVTIIAALVAFVVNSVGVYLILDLISPIISIVFNMIIVRIGFATTRSTLVSEVETWPQNSGLGSDATSGSNRSPSFRTRRNISLEMKSIAVEISRCVEIDGASSLAAEGDKKMLHGDLVTTGIGRDV